MRFAENTQQKLAIIENLQVDVFRSPAIETTERGYSCKCGYIGGDVSVFQCIGFGSTEEEAIIACWQEIDTLRTNQYLFNGVINETPRQEYILNRQNEWAHFEVRRG